MIGIGTDLVELDRFRLALTRTPGIVDRLFTDDERAYAQLRKDPTERFAARFVPHEPAHEPAYHPSYPDGHIAAAHRPTEGSLD